MLIKGDTNNRARNFKGGGKKGVQKMIFANLPEIDIFYKILGQNGVKSPVHYVLYLNTALPSVMSKKFNAMATTTKSAWLLVLI